jgi:CRISPR-associated protein Cas2
MSRGRRRYLLAYDIADRKRGRQVHKIAKGYGWSMQFSVFVCDLDTIELIGLRTDLGKVINHGHDSIALIDVGLPTDRGVGCFSFMGVHPALPTSGPIII